MAINELHLVYPNRNSGLRTAAKQMFEFGKTIAQEPSSGHSNGMDEHAIGRQRQYIAQSRDLIKRLNDKPRPDRPGTHPTDMMIDFSVEYNYFTEDLNGNAVPLNEATQELAESWLICAVELAKSQSAALAGSMEEFDFTRAGHNIDAIEELVDAIEQRPTIDLPETALAGAPLQKRSGGSKAK